MRDRLTLLHRLLSNNGTLFVHIDDNELAYLTVLLDEIFGRSNRVAIITFKQSAVTGHKAMNPGVVTTSNFVLIYARDKANWQPRRIFTQRERNTRYSTFIENPEDPYQNWRFITLSQAIGQVLGVPERSIRRELGEKYESYLNEFVIKHAERVVCLARPDYSAVGAEAKKKIDESRSNPSVVVHLARQGFPDMFFVRGERILFYADRLRMIDGELVAGEPLTTIWDDIPSNNLYNEGGVSFSKGKKPEALIKRCLDMCTDEGDLVLDSFAGSGTTGAVAHKMHRRWIMIESKDQCNTHIVPRMRSVIDGTDSSGITKAVQWRGGGGFGYYRLTPAIRE